MQIQVNGGSSRVEHQVLSVPTNPDACRGLLVIELWNTTSGINLFEVGLGQQNGLRMRVSATAESKL